MSRNIATMLSCMLHQEDVNELLVCLVVETFCYLSQFITRRKTIPSNIITQREGEDEG